MGGEVIEWISVEDELPEEDLGVILFDGNDVFEGVIIRFEHDKPAFINSRYLRRIDVTHWMPMPKPPKTE